MAKYDMPKVIGAELSFVKKDGEAVNLKFPVETDDQEVIQAVLGAGAVEVLPKPSKKIEGGET